MKPVISCSLLIALVPVAGIVACDHSKSSKDVQGGDGNIGGAPPVPSAQAGVAAGKVAGSRVSVDCAQHLSQSESISARVGSPRKAEPGAWGGVASVLRALPPGAKLCGALYFVSKSGSVSKDAGSVIISSALNADELRTFYQPVFTKAGCTFAEKTAGPYSFSWSCPKELGNALTIVVEREAEVFAIGFMANAS
jgi:hypothetical protein